MHVDTEKARTRVGEIIESVADALTSLPDPAATILARHAETAGPATDPPISATSLIADAALYGESTTPALVLSMVGRQGTLYLEGHPDEAAHQAEIHQIDGARAWWHPLTPDGQWQEVTSGKAA